MSLRSMQALANLGKFKGSLQMVRNVFMVPSCMFMVMVVCYYLADATVFHLMSVGEGLVAVKTTDTPELFLNIAPHTGKLQASPVSTASETTESLT